MTDRERIVEIARSCIGTPFHHQGRVAGVGLDCGGLAAHIAKEIGADYIDIAGYGREPNKRQLVNLLESEPCLKRVAPSEIELGDILLFSFANEPHHLAIYAGNTIIHAFERTKKCTENRFDKFWRSRLVLAYRFV